MAYDALPGTMSQSQVPLPETNFTDAMHRFAGRRCMDFASNPYATVLMPEPMDYFAACSATSMCQAKCHADFQAFDRQLATEMALHSVDPVTKTIEKTTESLLFVDLDEDAFTPMRIMAMVELSDCRYSICLQSFFGSTASACRVRALCHGNTQKK
jgi:hypothetical protein